MENIIYKIKNKNTSSNEIITILKILKIDKIIYRKILKEIKKKWNNINQIEKNIIYEYIKDKKYIDKIKNNDYTLYIYKNKKSYYCKIMNDEIKKIIIDNNITTIYNNNKKINLNLNKTYKNFNFDILI